MELNWFVALHFFITHKQFFSEHPMQAVCVCVCVCVCVWWWWWWWWWWRCRVASRGVVVCVCVCVVCVKLKLTIIIYNNTNNYLLMINNCYGGLYCTSVNFQVVLNFRVQNWYPVRCNTKWSEYSYIDL